MTLLFLPIAMFCVATDPVGPSVTIIAGTGHGETRTMPFASDDPTGLAMEVSLDNPFGIEISADAIWFTTFGGHCVWRLDRVTSQLTRVAGNGMPGYSGDNGPATSAMLNQPHEVRSDRQGNLYIADTTNHVIRRVDANSGIITTLAGDGKPGFRGDGKSGSEVQFFRPHSIALDAQQRLWVADTHNHRLRRIDLETGIVETVCGTGKAQRPADGQAARDAPLHGPRSLAIDANGVWIVLREGNSVWRLDTEQAVIHHIAGTGAKGYSGDGGNPHEATFNGPKGLVVGPDGKLFVVDTENHAVRVIDAEGKIIETCLGGSAAPPNLARPHGIAADASGNIYVGDSEHHRILKQSAALAESPAP